MRLLEEIEWNRLSDVMGKATDVPDLLRVIASGDSEERNSAWHEIYTKLCHQSTVGEATAYAASVLIDLLREPHVPDRLEILSFLREISNFNYFRLAGRRDLAPDLKGSIVAELHERLQEKYGSAGAAHYAVSRGVPVYLELTREEDAQTRLAAIYVLASCVSRYDEIAPIFFKRLKSEASHRFKAAWTLGLLDLDTTVVDHDGALRNVLGEQTAYMGVLARSDDESPLVRLAATYFLVRMNQSRDEEISDDIYDLLGESFDLAVEDQQLHTLIPWSEDEWLTDIQEILV